VPLHHPREAGRSLTFVHLQLPAEHLRWDALLRSLGMRDAPGPSGLLVLLADVSDASNGAPLNANERRAALRLLAALCDDADAAQASRILANIHRNPKRTKCT